MSVCDVPSGSLTNTLKFSQHHEDEDLGAFDNATQRILGPKKDRNPSSTAFENTNGTRKRDGPRVYSVGCSVQQLRKVVAPNASLKRKHTQAAQERQVMVKEFLDVSTISVDLRRSTLD